MNRILASTTLSFMLLGSFSAAMAQSDKGAEMSEEHKSNVAEVVQDLKELAGKDRNIGEEIRVVAQEQASSSKRAVEAIEKVEARSGFKTFLIGTDYKNIGAIRSEIVTTQNHIDRLTKAMDRATSATVKAGLASQIEELKKESVAVETFVKTNESRFSLFGWFVRLFQ